MDMFINMRQACGHYMWKKNIDLCRLMWKNT